MIVLDDCDDISAVADDSIPVGDRGTLEDNVPNDQSTNIDVATQKVSAADAIDHSSQPMVALNIDNVPASTCEFTSLSTLYPPSSTVL